MWQIERTLRWCQHSVSRRRETTFWSTPSIYSSLPRIFLSLSTVFEWVLIPRLSFTFSGGRDSQESFIKFHLLPLRNLLLPLLFFFFFQILHPLHFETRNGIACIYVEIRWSVWFLESEYMKNLGEPHLKWKMHKTKLFNLFFRRETAVEFECYLLIRHWASEVWLCLLEFLS